jgi:hypothetical protein
VCSTAVKPMRAPKMLGVGRDRRQRLGGGPEQEVVDDGLVGERQRPDRGRQGKGDVIMGNRQQLGLHVSSDCLARALTLWAVSVAAGVVGDARVGAVLAALDVPAERRGAGRSRSPT